MPAGVEAVTCFSGRNWALDPNGSCIDPDGFVVGIVDGRTPPPSGAGSGSGPVGPGLNWCAPMYHNDGAAPPNQWRARNLGQVFGICIDDRSNPSIYVTAAAVYGPFPGSPACPVQSGRWGPGGPGGVYRLDGTNGAISTFASLPNSGIGLGNICYDPVTKRFYVSNFEDGLIYRLSLGGSLLNTFDHGVQARPNEGFPTITDDGSAGLTQAGRRVWGLQVYQGRLYYGVWNDDYQPGVDQEVWSVQLDPGGDFMPATAKREIILPPYPNQQFSNPPSDIAFSNTGRMLVAERGWSGGYPGAHNSRNLEYTLSGPNWVPSPRQFFVGNLENPSAGIDSTNAAGGVDYDCAGDVWSSGDALVFGNNGRPAGLPADPSGTLVYGLQKTPGSGNSNVNTAADYVGLVSYYVDLDGNTTTTNKTEIGDVEVNRVCAGIPGDDCKTDVIILNSGYDHNNNTTYPIGASDASWILISDPDSGTTEPRPATVILKHPAWQNPQPNSQWLSSYPSASNDLNGPYIYQTCFCLEDQFNVKLDLCIRADDMGSVYINETPANILSNTAVPLITGPSTSYGGATPGCISITNQSLFHPGVNCIQIKDDNLGNVAMGFNVAAQLSGTGIKKLGAPCCDQGSWIQGRKWNDLDCDGVMDPGEPILPGWTIKLSDGSTAVTDSNGYYYFSGLPPGNYTVSEVLQNGWTQCYPTGGTHQVQLGSGVVVSNLDFGNKRSDCLLVSKEKILCKPGQPGTFTYTFDITNLSNQTVQYILMSPATGSPWTLSPNTINLGTPLPPNGTTTVTVTITGAQPGSNICIDITLADKDVKTCCHLQHCVDLPRCDCIQISSDQISCDPTGAGYVYTFTVDNLLAIPLYHMYVVVYSPAGASLSPTYFPLAPLNPYQSVTQTVNISGVKPGDVVCFKITVHQQNFVECCSIDQCVTIPDCGTTGGTDHPPVIGGTLLEPKTASPGAAIHVAALVEDDHGVTAVTANAVQLTNTGPGAWEGTIVADPALGMHDVQFVAFDTISQTDESTDSYETVRLLNISNQQTTYEIMQLAQLNFVFTVTGRAIRIDDNTFTVDDGSSTVTKVHCVGHGLQTGACVRASGTLDVSTSPPVLTCQKSQVVSLD